MTQIVCVSCPICKRNFVPAPFHYYKVKEKKVCSWSCMLEGERRSEAKRLDKKNKKCYN